MNQQINLCLPTFRRQRQIFSAATLLRVLGIVAVALLAMSGYARWQLAGSEAEVASLESQEKALTARMGGVSSIGSSRRKEVEEEISRLDAKALSQRTLAALMRERSLGATTGFSAYLAALGRRHLEGLWLTKISINGATAAMELAGRSVRSDLVPLHLQRLGEETALAGQRFDRLKIERGTQGEQVEFHVSSTAVDGEPEPAQGKKR